MTTAHDTSTETAMKVLSVIGKVMSFASFGIFFGGFGYIIADELTVWMLGLDPWSAESSLPGFLGGIVGFLIVGIPAGILGMLLISFIARMLVFAFSNSAGTTSATHTASQAPEPTASEPSYSGAGLYERNTLGQSGKAFGSEGIQTLTDASVDTSKAPEFGKYRNQVVMNGRYILDIHEGGLLLYHGMMKRKYIGALPADRVEIEVYDEQFTRNVTVKDRLTGEVFSGPASLPGRQPNKLIHGYS